MVLSPAQIDALEVPERPTAGQREQQVMEETWRNLPAGEKLELDLSRAGQGGGGAVAMGLKGAGIMSEVTSMMDPEMIASLPFEERIAMQKELMRRASRSKVELARDIERNPVVEAGRKVQAATDRNFPRTQPESVTRPLGGLFEGLGNLAPSLATGVLGIPTALVAGGSMELSDAYDREMERQKQSGEPVDPEKAMLKALPYALGASAIEAKLGIGRILGKIQKYFGSRVATETGQEIAKKGWRAGMDFMKERAKDFGAGFTEEASQRLLQDLIVEGEPDLEAILQEGMMGGGAQAVSLGFAKGTAAAARKVAERQRRAIGRRGQPPVIPPPVIDETQATTPTPPAAPPVIPTGQAPPPAAPATPSPNAPTPQPGAPPATPPTPTLDQAADRNQWQVTVQAEQTMPDGKSKVQIDDVTGGQNVWSKSPETLKKEGFDVPDFSKIPPGKYSYMEAEFALKAEPIGRDSKLLLKRLNEAKAVLAEPYRTNFGTGRLDGEKKRLISTDGAVALQWVNDGKTARGSVSLVELKPPTQKGGEKPSAKEKEKGKKETVLTPKAPVTPPAPTPPPASKWKPIGLNRDGHPLFEDERGVRSYVRTDGVRVTEPVQIGDHGPSFQTTTRNLPPIPKPDESATKTPDTSGTPPTVSPPKELPTTGKVTDVLSDADKARLAELQKRMRAKLGQTNIGPDPEIVVIGTEMAGLYIKAGTKRFAQFAKQVKADLPDIWDKLKSYLRQIWEGAAVENADIDELSRAESQKIIEDLDKSGTVPEDADEPTEGSDGGGLPGGDQPPTTGESGEGGETGSGDQAEGEGIQPGTGKGSRGGSGGGRRGSRGKAPAPADTVSEGEESETTDAGTGEAGAEGTGQLPTEPSGPRLKNFYPESDPAPTGQVARVKANIEALTLVKQLEKEGRQPTDEERAVLAAWSGWGSFKEVFNQGRAQKREWDQSWQRTYGRFYDQLRELLTEEEFNAAAESSVNAHYTSQEVIEAGLWAAVRRLGFTGGRVLEPGAGKGSIIAFSPADMRDNLRWGAVEMEPITGKILQYLYPEADVRIQPFEETKIPNAFYDMAISNVPFHEIGPGKEYPDLNLHNYFIARMLDKVKPGGVVVVITSKNTMDNRPEQRRFLASKGQLIGAIRLPNNAFKESAGTEVVTDILFIRKPDGKPFQAEKWENTSKLEGPIVNFRKQEDYELNEYFANHPEMVLGKHARTGSLYGKNEYTVESTGPLLPKLQAAVNKLPENILTPAKEEETSKTTQLDDYTLVIENGKVLESRGYKLELPEGWDPTNKTLVKRAKDYIGLRDALSTQYALERNPEAKEADLEANRKKLRAHYQAWRKAHGPLNQNDRKTSYLSSDPGYYMVLALENVKEIPDPNDATSTITKIEEADVLTKRMIQPDIPPTKAANATDALGVVMAYRGNLDMEYMRELTGLTDEQIEAELIQANLAFKNPESGLLETATEYLTGDVRDKLAKAIFAAKDSSEFNRNVTALNDVIPAKVPFDKIAVDITARWTPTTVLNRFANEVLGLEGNPVRFVAKVEEFSVGEVRHTSEAAKSKWSTGDMSGPRLFEHALNFKRAEIKKRVLDENNKENYVKDEDGTALANQTITAMKAAYAEWIRTTDQRVQYRYFDEKQGEYQTETMAIWDVMEREFNRVANSFVVPDYDGSMLKLPGLSNAVRRTPHLMNGVMRAIAGGSAVFAHGTGSGKTFLLTVASNELRRIGLAKKPVLVVKKPTTAQFRVSIERAYPGSRVLIPSKKDFDPANRKKLISRIASTKWDFIVLTHEQFKSIKPSDTLVKAFFEDQIAQLRQILKDRGQADAENKKSTRGMDSSTRNIVRKIKALKKRLDKHVESLKKNQDKATTWENLGIDALFIDESHNFKKMPIPTNMEGEVKGIPSDFSQRAVDLLIKVRDIQRVTNGRNVFFASGTPVSNTLAELWVQFHAVNPQLLEDYSIETFDGFASMFADVVTNFELGWDGSFKNVTRMSRFKNPAGLTTLTRLGMDVKIGNKELGLDVPRVENDKPTVRVIKPTAGFERWLEFLDKIVEGWEGLDAKGRFFNSWVAIATMRAGVAAALDPRCVFPDAQDDPQSKVNQAVRNIVEEWNKGKELRTTMMVFADMYRTMNTSKLMGFVGHGWTTAGGAPTEAEIDVDVDDVDLPAGQDEAATEAVESADDTGDTGAADEKAYEANAVGSFNLYNDIRAKLIAAGVPENEIAIITEHDTDAKRESLFNKVRQGVVRILIGSTEKIGEGVDVPQRMSAQFHLDPPSAMTPAKMEQRIGRIIRQGNMFSEKNLNQPVRLNFYAQERSMDAAIYQMLETKGVMVIQALKGQFLGDSFEDPASELTLAMATMKAAATGDTRVLDMAKLQEEVRALNLEQGAYFRRVSELRSDIENQEREARNARAWAALEKKLSQTAEQTTADEEKTTMLHVTSQKRVTGMKEIKEWLKKARVQFEKELNKLSGKGEVVLPLIFGENLRALVTGSKRIETTRVFEDGEYKGERHTAHIDQSVVFYIGGPEPKWNDARYDASIASIESLPTILNNLPETAANRSNKQLETAKRHDAAAAAASQQLAAASFTKDAELKEKKAALSAIETALRTEKAARTAAREAARKAKQQAQQQQPPGQTPQTSLPGEEPTGTPAAPVASTLEEFRQLVTDNALGLHPQARDLILAFLDSPVAKLLPDLWVTVQDQLEGGWQGSYLNRLVHLARNASPETGVHELSHALWEILPNDIKAEFERLRVESINELISKPENAAVIAALEQLRDNPTENGQDFVNRGFPPGIWKEIFPYASAEEFFTHANSKHYQAKVGSMVAGFWDRVKGIWKAFVQSIKNMLQANRSLDQRVNDWLSQVESGDFEATAQGSAGAVREESERQASLRFNVSEAETAKETTLSAGPDLTDVELQEEITRANAEGRPEDEPMFTQVFGRKDQIISRDGLTPETVAAGRAYAGQVLQEVGLDVELDQSGRWRLTDEATPNDMAGLELVKRLRQEISQQEESGAAKGYLGNLLDSVVVNMTPDRVKAFSEATRGELYSLAQGERSHRGLMLGALSNMAKTVEYVARNAGVILKRVYADAFGGESIGPTIDAVRELFRKEFTREEIMAVLNSNVKFLSFMNQILPGDGEKLRTIDTMIQYVLSLPFRSQEHLAQLYGEYLVNKLGINPTDAQEAAKLFAEAFADKFKAARTAAARKAAGQLRDRIPQPYSKGGKALWRKIEEAVNAGIFDTDHVLKQLAGEFGWKVPTDRDLDSFKRWVDEMQKLREVSPREAQAGVTTVDKMAATMERRVALKKQIETLWSRLTHPLNYRTMRGARNIAAAVNEFTAANLLLRLSFAPRQFIDVITQGGIHTPTRAVSAAIERWQNDKEEGRDANLWREVSQALLQAYQQRIAATRSALSAARSAFAGTGEARNVDRLMSRIAIFERAMQAADEASAQGNHVKAAMLRAFALLRLGYRIAQALDNIHGLPAEYQEMRQQVTTALRQQGQSPAESFVNTDQVMGDMKAEFQHAAARAQELSDLNGWNWTPRQVEATAWHIVKGRQYQRMREMGLPADDFEETNRVLRNVVGWNEREEGGIGGVVANMVGKASGYAQSVGLPLPLARFGNAIGIGINRTLSFTPMGFFPEAFEGSPWYRTSEDRRQRKMEAAIGTSVGMSLFLLAATGAIIVRLRWPKDKEERELWEREGHRPGTVEIPVGDGKFITISTTTGPLGLVRPYLAAGGAIHDILDKRAKAQEKLNAEALKKGLPPGKIPPMGVAEMMAIAANTGWGAVTGGRTASGMLGSVTDFGSFNPRKFVSGLVSPVVPGLPAYQEAARLAGVQIDTKTASIMDFMVPLPGSKAAKVNMLGDPVGSEEGLQRVLQILTGGTSPVPIDPKEAQQSSAYQALYETGYRPPSINPNQGYSINGQYRPMDDAELEQYAQARGELFKQELMALGPSPDKKAVQAAYRRANEAALARVGVSRVPRTGVSTPGGAESYPGGALPGRPVAIGTRGGVGQRISGPTRPRAISAPRRALGRGRRRSLGRSRISRGPSLRLGRGLLRRRSLGRRRRY